MKQKLIFLFFIFTISTFAQDSSSEVEEFILSLNEQKLTYDSLSKIKSDKNTIFQNVVELELINNDIYLFSKKAQDKNSTIYDDQINYLKVQKDKILQNFPNELLKGKAFDFQSANLIFNKQILLLQNELKAQTKDSFNADIIQNKITILKITQSFYQDLSMLKQSYFEGVNKSAIDKFLRSSVSKIQINGFLSAQNLSFKEQSEQDLQILRFTILLETYEDILLNLSKNSSFFGTNFIVKSLRLNKIVNYINGKVGLESDYVDIGKVVVMLIIALFIFLIRRLIYKLIYFIFINSFLNVKTDPNSQARALKMIESPIGIFLILINIELWIALFYHPAPIPPKIVMILEILYTLIATWFVIQIVEIYGSIVVQKFTKPSTRKGIVSVILRIIKLLLLVIALIAILQEIGFDPTALLTSLGIGGIALAIGAKDMISNFFASVMLIFNDSISQGDWIVINGVEGTVVEIGVKNTVIRGFDNSLNYLPNSSISSSSIKNFSKRRVGSRIKFELKISYETSEEVLQKCLEDIRNMLLNNPKISNPNDELPQVDDKLKENNPDISVSDLIGFKTNIHVNFNKFSDSIMNILIYCFAKSVHYKDQLQVQEEILFEIIKILENNGVDFGIPNQILYLSNLSNKTKSFLKKSVI